MKRHFALCSAALLVLAVSLIPAQATVFCTVLPTVDGFVALRTGPSAKARLVARMKADDEVMLGLGQRNGWMEVTWWRGDDRGAKGFGASSSTGWVKRSLISSECG
jgi:hypothetical protein